jgi:hypothetical protein
MPTLKKFSITGTVGILEGIAHLPDKAPSAIAVVAHPLPTMSGTMGNKVVTTLAKTFVELDFVALRFTQSPDVWLQSLPTQNHRLKAWQKWASMYGRCCANCGRSFTYVFPPASRQSQSKPTISSSDPNSVS